MKRNSMRKAAFQREDGWCESLCRCAEPVLELFVIRVRRENLPNLGGTTDKLFALSVVLMGVFW